MDEAGGSKTLDAVERAMSVLELFAESNQPTLGVTEIAETLGLSKAVVHRVLTTLKVGGLVESDPATRRYRLGPTTLRLGLVYLDRIDVREMARSRMRLLSDTTSETATLSVRSGWQRTYVDQVVPQRELKMTVDLGRPFPLHAGSSGKAFLAFLSAEEIDAYLDQDLPQVTSKTVTDPTEIRAELERIRHRGFAMSFGERQTGAGSVAAPILNHEAIPVAVMSVCGPHDRFQAEVREVSAALIEATTEISERLGYH